jgi:hypothetical protein
LQIRTLPRRTFDCASRVSPVLMAMLSSPEKLFFRSIPFGTGAVYFLFSEGRRQRAYK